MISKTRRAAGFAFAALAVAVGVGSQWPVLKPRLFGVGPKARQTLSPGTRFFAPPPNPGAVQQIAGLARANALRDAALLTAMAATPQAVWFTASSPEEVQSAVHRTVIRATHEQTVPVLVAYNLPYRDCAQYGSSGAIDAATYAAWIDGFAKGLANEKVVVILEPNSLGIIPYATEWTDWCKPTITDAQGRTVPAPGATATDRYALLAKAIDSIESQAPNAAVYLDGTHGGWLPVGEMARRLVKAGIERVQGFTVNVSNFQPTSESIKYGTWVSKCIAYASHPPRGANRTDPYSDCPTPRHAIGGIVTFDWSSPERWYAERVDGASPPASGGPTLAHFVIDTGRNGRGPLEARVYAAAPYGQPPPVIAGVEMSDYCNPPRAGLGPRPSASTGVPLVDAYLWVKAPGKSDGSCDVAGTFPRQWDYTRYNPWGITGDAQKHFDPLWGMVDPEVDEWFPEAALQLARNAVPPLQEAAGQLLAPDDNGRVERSTTGTTGIQGRWFAAADTDDCHRRGKHAVRECSLFITPDPQAPAFGPTADLGMCTVGVVAKAVAGSDGTADYANIYGARIGLTLNDGAPFDAPAHGVTGFAFHIDSELPLNAGIRVQMATVGANLEPALWGGAVLERSPVHAGHNEFRWADVGGPFYVRPQPRFDASKLLSIAFEVPTDAAGAKTFSFCIGHLTALTN